MKKILMSIIIILLVTITFSTAFYKNEKDILNTNFDISSSKITFDDMVIGQINDNEKSRWVNNGQKLGELPIPKNVRNGFTFDIWVAVDTNFKKIGSINLNSGSKWFNYTTNTDKIIPVIRTWTINQYTVNKNYTITKLEKYENNIYSLQRGDVNANSANLAIDLYTY